MAPNNTEIRILDSGIDYAPARYGKKTGEPTVRVDLSRSDEKKKRVGAIEGQFDSYGWKEKLRSGFARMRVGGTGPLYDENREGLESFVDLIGPRFVDLELGPDNIKKPPRNIQNIVDTYIIFVPLDRDYDEEAFEFYTERAQQYGDVEFLFKIGKYNDDEKVRAITRDYKMYDSDVWLYPRGKKPSTVADNLEKCIKFGKANTWNVSPRQDILEDLEFDEWERTEVFSLVHHPNVEGVEILRSLSSWIRTGH